MQRYTFFIKQRKNASRRGVPPCTPFTPVYALYPLYALYSRVSYLNSMMVP